MNRYEDPGFSGKKMDFHGGSSITMLISMAREKSMATIFMDSYGRASFMVASDLHNHGIQTHG